MKIVLSVPFNVEQPREIKKRSASQNNVFETLIIIDTVSYFVCFDSANLNYVLCKSTELK